jgi:NifU-like protein
MTFYPPKINERFLHPQNAGEIENASAIGNGGSFVCGAALRIYLEIKDGKIVKAKFKAAGCGFLFASADVVCEKIVGEDFAEVGRKNPANAGMREEVFFERDFKHKFPANRTHCLKLCLNALRAAIDDYRSARLESWNGDEALICTCFGVAEKTIETTIVKNGLTTVEEVIDNCSAGGGCGACQPLIMEILEDVWRGAV